MKVLKDHENKSSKGNSKIQFTYTNVDFVLYKYDLILIAEKTNPRDKSTFALCNLLKIDFIYN